MRLPDSQPDVIKRQVVKALDDAGMIWEAEAIRECGKWFNVYLCPNDGEREYSLVQPCKKRLCPWCSKLRQKKAYALYHEPLAAVKEPKMMVLTVKNVPIGDLKPALDRLGKALTKFWQKSLKKRVKGAVCAIEVTFNREDQTWHPHAHVLLDGPYLEQAWIANQWIRATQGRGRVVWIERCRAGWEKELLKYVTKQVSFLDVPAALREFVFAAKRFRFLRCWGSFYNLDEKLEGDEWERTCPKCREKMILLERNCSLERLLKDGGGIFGSGSEHYENARGSPEEEVIYLFTTEKGDSTPARSGGFTWQPSLLDQAGIADEPHDLRELSSGARRGSGNLQGPAGYGVD